MDFSEALNAMKEGKIARLMTRGELHTFVLSPSGFQRVYTGDILREWKMLDEDILSDNWEVVENWITKEDIPEVKIQNVDYFQCPHCGCSNFGFGFDIGISICCKCGKSSKVVRRFEEERSEAEPIFTEQQLKDAAKGMDIIAQTMYDAVQSMVNAINKQNEEQPEPKLSWSQAVQAMKADEAVRNDDFEENEFIIFLKYENLEIFPNGTIIKVHSDGGQTTFEPTKEQLNSKQWDVTTDWRTTKAPSVEIKNKEFFECPYCRHEHPYTSGMEWRDFVRCGFCGFKVLPERKEEQSDVLTKYREWLKERIESKKKKLEKYIEEREFVFAGMTSSYFETFDLCYDKLVEFENEAQK